MKKTDGLSQARSASGIEPQPASEPVVDATVLHPTVHQLDMVAEDQISSVASLPPLAISNFWAIVFLFTHIFLKLFDRSIVATENSHIFKTILIY